MKDVKRFQWQQILLQNDFLDTESTNESQWLRIVYALGFALGLSIKLALSQYIFVYL
jgi:hypothetical protein